MRHTTPFVPVIFAFLVAIVVIAPSRASGTDGIAVWKDYNCFTNVTGPGLHTLQVVHNRQIGALALRFKVQVDPALGWQYVSETHALPNTVGNFESGITICYDACTSGDIILGTITYQSYGPPTQCGVVGAVPHPDAETLDVVTCEGQSRVAGSLPLTVYAGIGPACGTCSHAQEGIVYPGMPHVFDCETVPAKTSTWGAIKALYR